MFYFFKIQCYREQCIKYVLFAFKFHTHSHTAVRLQTVYISFFVFHFDTFVRKYYPVENNYCEYIGGDILYLYCVSIPVSR